MPFINDWRTIRSVLRSYLNEQKGRVVYLKPKSLVVYATLRGIRLSPSSVGRFLTEMSEDWIITGVQGKSYVFVRPESMTTG